MNLSYLVANSTLGNSQPNTFLQLFDRCSTLKRPYAEQLCYTTKKWCMTNKNIVSISISRYCKNLVSMLYWLWHSYTDPSLPAPHNLQARLSDAYITSDRMIIAAVLWTSVISTVATDADDNDDDDGNQSDVIAPHPVHLLLINIGPC